MTGTGGEPADVEGLVRGAEKVDQLIVDDLHELLARGDARHHLFPQGLLP